MTVADSSKTSKLGTVGGLDGRENRYCATDRPLVQVQHKGRILKKTRKKCPSKPTAPMIQRIIYECLNKTYDSNRASSGYG